MKKMFGIVVCLLVTFCLWKARAGQRTPASLVLNANGNPRWAVGGVGGTRNSNDNTDSIGCTIEGCPTTSQDCGPTFGTPSGLKVSCHAVSQKYGSVNCTSTAWPIISVAQTIEQDSYLVINSDANNVCTYLSVSNGSQYEPPVYQPPAP
jgi:hypothetical protein